MHGWEIGSGSRKRIRHMRPVSTSTGGVAAAVDDTGLVVADSSSPRSFFKDVRKISIGDCALFKPQQDSPPFIGIIRSLGSDKENNLQLGVNWLYRPTDVKLLKGISPEAAPNEVFYSFHRDETPAASLLHPCKVAFLPRGVELPSGISSFVCRRVYDTANKRLWWLTDQDYIDDRQEEVDKLLRKTQTEMHATVQQQQGGRSPKPVNSPMSTSQLKQSPDSVQNSTTVFPSQTKGKKRERSDQAAEPVKRERSSKADDGDSGLPRSEVMLKSEIAKITEKGGLVDSEGVERLVHLMQPDKSERKMDLACRSLLAGVIAATDKDDCLDQFVQLRGLRVLDEWLQEAHKGKIGDSSSPRDQDRSVEDFLLVLLRALDRLPVNLNALQMCNIGKSVNHLRSHRNSEIQKKARSLVDTWKKRVEAEMNINDTKSGTSQAVSWPARTRNEVSQVANRHPSGSDAAMKNSISQLSSSKSAPVKLVQGEAVVKSPSASASPGNVKLSSSPASTSASLRDGHLRTSVISGSSELPQSVARDEKSSGSSHSHTNSQCSSDHAKNVGPSVKEDARSSNSGSTSLNKSSGSGSRHRKTANGLQGPAVSAHPKEDGSSRNASLSRISVSEKISQLPVKCEKIDAPVSESNNHKLIVKISNRGRSPAQSVNGGSVEDPSSTNSRASSPVNPDKHGQLDHNPKEKCEGFRNSAPSDVNTESWQSNDLKDGVTGCDEGDGSPATAPDFGRCTTGDEAGKLTSVTKNISSTKNEIKSRKSLDSSLSSINALIESCVKYSEANVAISAGDDVGMNLLASVAAGEISKSGAASPAHSPQRSTSVADETCRDYNGKSKPDVDASIGDQNRINTSSDTETQKQNVTSSASPAHNEDQSDQCRTSGKDSLHNVESSSKLDKKTDDSGAAVCVSPGATCAGSGEGLGQAHESKAGVKDLSNVRTPNRREGSNSCLATEDKVNDASLRERTRVRHAETPTLPSAEAVDEKKDVKPCPKSSAVVEQIPAAARAFESTIRNEKATVSTSIVNNLLPGQLNDFKTEDHDVDCGKLADQGANIKVEQEKSTSPASQKQEDVLDSGVADIKPKGSEVDIGNQEVASAAASKINSSAPAGQDKEKCSDAKLSLAPGEGAEREEAPSAEVTSPVPGSSSLDGKLGFDLNEGFDVDDCKDGDPSGMTVPGSVSSVRLVSPLPSHSTASASIGLPASVTVAAAAKGAFVPPEDLLRSKGELKWKGSAATSAFRPAEPRRFPEVSTSTHNAPAPDVSSGKQGRTFLEIDLNIADELVMEETSCQNTDLKAGKRDECGANNGPTGSASGRYVGGLDLDLNRVDETLELGQPPSQSLRFDSSLQQAKFSSSSAFSNNDSGRRDFDLNNGPAADEVAVESSGFNQHGRFNISTQPSVGFRINNADLGNLNSWYPAGSTFSALPIPASLPDREQPFPIVGTGGVPPRMLGGPTGTMPFNPDMYRGSVLSSSPAVPFPAAPFQYPVFPFGTNFPLPSSSLPGGSATFVDPSSGGRLCIPAVPSQLVGTAPNISSQYPRPYFVSLSDVSSSVAGDSAQKWGRQGLDLNAGPGGPDAEGRDETLVIPQRQVPNIGSLALADEQSRMLYSVGGGVLKRKEPDGGWDSDRLNYKQHTWQ